MYGGSSRQYDRYGNMVDSGQYGNEAYMNQADYGQNTYSEVNQYMDNSGYGTTSSYSSGGRQSRSTYRNCPSPGVCLSPTSPSGADVGGYGSPVPRRSKSPGIQLIVPGGEIDTGKRMSRYRSCSPGRRNALIGMEGQESASQNIVNNNPYGRYDSCSSLSPTHRGHPQSGVETPSVIRPSAVKFANRNANVCSNELIHRSRSRSPGMGVGNYSYSSSSRNPSMVSGRRLSGSRHAYTPSVGPVNSDIIRFFNLVDTDRSGKISWDELQKALLNGDWSEFGEETCRLMISMFDSRWSGTIDINEFTSLWRYIQDWKAMFETFDVDGSGTIDGIELHRAFQSFGYQVSNQFAQLVVRIYDKKGMGCIHFDSFINACVLLKLLTNRFEEKDPRGAKRIQLDMEQFIEMVVDTFLIQC
ncbi:calpain-3 [Octopus bimaculoides]|uniref:EF-hand domain-containing protein n=1 Tax=Octopus bimaculoides TaxID=37653 RepID=A0A0L8HZM3_OCTBM|nr:calpain-3 [Octopus bimaculoides]|eukprot:XP_014768326.1 PREDICTED: calpain-3-like [Octopus bimaculoides]